MSKFKSGDRVITTHQWSWYEPGETLTLTSPYSGWRGCIAGWFVTKYPDNSRFVHESDIKLLEENMETNVKAMLKNGDRVVMRDGEDFVVIDDTFIRVDKEAWEELGNYHNNGLHDSVNRCDIVKVLRPTYVGNTLLKDTPSNKFHIIYEEKVETEAEKQLKELQKQIQTLTKQADKLGEEIWKGKL